MLISKTLRLDKHTYYETHLSLINCLLPVKMTPKEIEVLARFMELDGSIAEDRFGTSARKMIKENLGLSDGGLGNFLGSLKKKRFLIKDTQTDKWIIHHLLRAAKDEQEYNFKLENHDS